MEELDYGWQTIDGDKNILIVAGHNFSHGRQGKIKIADLGTGCITRKICEKFGFFGIISTREQLDPNWYINSPFREKIREIIKEKNIDLVIDVHGKSLGSQNLVELIGNKKFKEKYKVKVEDFKENGQLTLAEEYDEKIPILEIEIREDGRVPTVDEVKYKESEKLIFELMEKLKDEN